MKFIDVVVAVLAKLSDQENPFVCEEEIEDLYCMRTVVLDEIKHHHEERTKFVATKAADSHGASVAGETGQDRVASGQEELRRDNAANEIASGTKKPAGEGNKCHSGELATSAATVPGATRVAAELERKQERAATRNKERCSTAVREEFLQAIKSPPALKPSRNQNE